MKWRARVYPGVRAAVGQVIREPWDDISCSDCAQEAKWLEEMRQAVRTNPRYGYRRIAVVSRLGFGRCRRLWKLYNFKLAAQRARKRRKLENSASRPHQAEYPNHVWTYDLLFERLADGKQFKTLSVLDEYEWSIYVLILTHGEYPEKSPCTGFSALRQWQRIHRSIGTDLAGTK